MEALMVVEANSTLSQQEITNRLRTQILSGNISPAAAGVQIRRIEKSLEDLKKDEEVKNAILVDTERYLNGQKKVAIFGAEVQVAAVYTKYDFTASKHKQYDAICNAIAELEERKKSIEEELTLLQKEDEAKQRNGKLGLGIVTKDIVIDVMPQLNWIGDGEIITIYPPNKIQKQGLKYFKL